MSLAVGGKPIRLGPGGDKMDMNTWTKTGHYSIRGANGPGRRSNYKSQSRWLTPLLIAALIPATNQVAADAGHGSSRGAEVQVGNGSGAFLLRPGGPDYLARSRAISRAGRDVIDTVIATSGLETFMTALQIAGLTGLLRTMPDVHLFAPNDQAFARLSPEFRNALFSDRTALMGMLSRHIVFKADAKGSKTVATAAEARTGRAQSGGAARGRAVDGRSTNGVVHVVDAVILTN
jgi:hypothetical protein